MLKKSYLDLLHPGRNKPQTPVGRLNSALLQGLSATGGSAAGFSLESEHSGLFSGDANSAAETLQRLGSDLESSLESLFTDSDTAGLMGSGAKMTQVVKDAFLDATIKAMNPVATLAAARNLRAPQAGKNTVVVNTFADDEADLMDFALESYEETTLRTNVVYAQQLNLRPGNQDDWNEMLFPTVIVPQDQSGYAISLPVVQVQDNELRNTDGSLVDFNRRALVHARIDPDILRDDDTKLIPIFRAGSEDAFVDDGVITPRPVKQMGSEVITSPLRVGAKFDLVGLSQSDAQIARNGAADIQDSVASGATVDALYIQFGDADAEVIKIETIGVDSNNFFQPPQGGHRTLRLAMDTKALALRGKVLQADGSDSVLFAGVEANRLVLNLHVELNGKIDSELGETTTSAPSVTAWAAFQVSADGSKVTELSLSDPAVEDLVALINAGEIIGYDLDAYRVDAGRRNQGQLLNNYLYTQIYATKRRAPLSVIRPQVDTVEAREATDLAAILEGLGSRTNAAGVAAVHRYNEILKNNVVNNDILGARPNVLGIAASTVLPYHYEGEIDVLAEIQTLNSTDKLRDICSTFMNHIRDQVYKAYVLSGYKATADSRYGNKSPKPLVLIATEPRVAAYLQVIGDARTLGDEFEFMVRSTLNKTMRDTIYVTFGVKEALTSGQPEPLHFGNLAWRTPLVYTLPTPRGGAHSNQSTAQPDFIHVINLPVLMKFKVKNLDEAVNSRIPVVGVVEP